MKCGICDKLLDPLNYAKIKIKDVTKIMVLNEKVKEKTTVLDLNICEECSSKIRGTVTNMILTKGDIPCTSS